MSDGAVMFLGFAVVMGLAIGIGELLWRITGPRRK